MTKPITTEQIEAYRISPQQADLFLRQRDLTEPLLAQCVTRLDGPLDPNALQRALTHVVTRHAILRTRFMRPEAIKLPLQVISEEARFDWRVLDAQAITAVGSTAVDADAVEDAESLSRALLEAERARSFDLENGPTLHAALLPLSAQQHLLALSMPALCADTRTLHNLFRELSAAYVRSLRDESENAEEAVQYLQFSEWQNEVLADEEAEEGRQYWRSQKVSSAPDLMLPFPAPLASAVNTVSANGTGRVRIALNARVADVAQALGLSEEVLLLSCWQALVWRLTGKSEVVTGQAQDGRKYEELNDALGSFARALPLRTAWPEGMTLVEAAREVEERVNEGRQWQEYFSWDRAGVAAMETGRARGAAVGYEYELRPEAVDAAGVSFSIAAQEVEGEGEAVKLKCVRAGAQLWAEVEYEQAIYQESGMRVLAEQMREIVESAVQRKGETKIEDLEMLPASHRQLLIELNSTAKEYASDKSLHQLFEEQVARTPEHVAVVADQQQLSYRELNSRANQLAHHLRLLGVGPESLVAIYMERSTEMVVALLGVLKAGGAYVPFDPQSPPERLAFMLEDVNAPVLLTQQELLSRLTSRPAHVLCLDTDWDSLAHNSVQNPLPNVTSENQAYVIYTSGSTGKPKGVMVTHANVARLFAATDEWFNFSEQDVWTLFHSYAFDFSVWEIWGALIYGGRLVVVPYLTSRSPDAFYQLLIQEGVTILNQTPSAFQQLSAADERVNEHNLSAESLHLALRFVIFGGEALDIRSLAPWFARHGDRQPQLINMYGITETTVHVTYRGLSAPDAQTASGSLIGNPIGDLQFYVLDQRMQPVPVGVAGEIFVGGAGLARGYLNYPSLTAEKFIPHPFAARGGERLYRTGDLARFRADGDIEYLGRTDHQVKVRGYRIELGEIEAVIKQHPDISEVVVLAREDVVGDKRIVAYLVSPAPEQLHMRDIRRLLSDKLPEYMIPSSLVPLKTLPLTPNGKVDSAALPAPGLGRAGIEEVYLAPRTALEEVVAAIWAETISIERVGIHDNFFELGGHSLLATQVISRIREEFEVELPVRLMFEGMSVEEMAEAIMSREAEAGQSEKIARAIKAVEEMGEGEFLEMLQQKRDAATKEGVQ